MRAEAAFESQCLKDLAAIGYLVHSLPDAQANRRQRGDSGFPDICFAGRGRVGFLELKVPRYKLSNVFLTDGQGEWRDAIEWAGQEAVRGAMRQGEKRPLFYAVATPKNWDAILEELA